ncbi:MAG: 1-acyl-sn-glycerol-3-phosphate acyltransferase [Burkholderiales bacterium]|nr:1-acyl-sn-glycerol-3-phosphate acyltransferase [Burkholderiales bacterium]
MNTPEPQEWPTLSPSAPRRDYGFLHKVGVAILHRAGWNLEGDFPDLPRVVIAVAPHSSNWDFIFGAAAMFALGLRVAFIGKHTLFREPLGSFMRWLGGIPIDRSRPEGFAEDMVKVFERNESLWLAITPEGTRRKGVAFKSGFYRIAKAVGVPIFPVYFNYRRKVIGFLPPVPADKEPAEGVEAIRRLLERHGSRKP